MRNTNKKLRSLRTLQTLIAKATILPGQSNSVAALIKSARGLSKQRRIGIYRDGFVARHISELRRTFPITEKLVGRLLFAQFCQIYIRSYKAKSPHLDDYGAKFSNCVAALVKTKSTLQCVRYISDIVRLEWLIEQLRRTPVDLNRSQALLSSVGQNHRNLECVLDSRCALFHSKYPVDKIYQMNVSKGSKAKLVLSSGAFKFIVIVKDSHPVIKRLTNTEYLVLKRIQRGSSVRRLATSCARGGIALDRVLPQLIVRGWVEIVRPAPKKLCK